MTVRHHGCRDCEVTVGISVSQVDLQPKLLFIIIKIARKDEVHQLDTILLCTWGRTIRTCGAFLIKLLYGRIPCHTADGKKREHADNRESD